MHLHTENKALTQRLNRLYMQSLNQYGRRLACLLSCNIGKLLQLLGADLTEVSE